MSHSQSPSSPEAFQAIVDQIRAEHGGAWAQAQQAINQVKVEGSASGKRKFLAEVDQKFETLIELLPGLLTVQRNHVSFGFNIAFPGKLVVHKAGAYPTYEGTQMGTIKKRKMPVPADKYKASIKQGFAEAAYSRYVSPGFTVSYKDLQKLPSFKRFCDLMASADVHVSLTGLTGVVRNALPDLREVLSFPDTNRFNSGCAGIRLVINLAQGFDADQVIALPDVAKKKDRVTPRIYLGK